jgi:hypothetical protein
MVRHEVTAFFGHEPKPASQVFVHFKDAENILKPVFEQNGKYLPVPGKVAVGEAGGAYFSKA